MDYWHRDRVLRAYFEGKDWAEHPEFQLKRRVVMSALPVLAEYLYLIEDEWELMDGRTTTGRGDLVFTDGCGKFAVVEVKNLDWSRSGPAARKARSRSREKVVEQARRYAREYCVRMVGVWIEEVHAFSATPEGVQWHAAFQKGWVDEIIPSYTEPDVTCSTFDDS